jgi:hypothetical protein
VWCPTPSRAILSSSYTSSSAGLELPPHSHSSTSGVRPCYPRAAQAASSSHYINSTFPAPFSRLSRRTYSSSHVPGRTPAPRDMPQRSASSKFASPPSLPLPFSSLLVCHSIPRTHSGGSCVHIHASVPRDRSHCGHRSRAIWGSWARRHGTVSSLAAPAERVESRDRGARACGSPGHPTARGLLVHAQVGRGPAGLRRVAFCRILGDAAVDGKKDGCGYSSAALLRPTGMSLCSRV